jgi:hypothetical protein
MVKHVSDLSESLESAEMAEAEAHSTHFKAWNFD